MFEMVREATLEALQATALFELIIMNSHADRVTRQYCSSMFEMVHEATLEALIADFTLTHKIIDSHANRFARPLFNFNV